MNTGKTVRIPVHMLEILLKIWKLEQTCPTNGKFTEALSICSKLNISLQNYETAIEVERRFINILPLDMFISQTGEELQYHDYMSGETQYVVGGYHFGFFNPLLIIEQKDTRARIFDLIAERLTPREQDIILERFGLRDEDPKTLIEIGRKYGRGRERIRQIEEIALRKLRIGIIRRASRDDYQWSELLNGGMSSTSKI